MRISVSAVIFSLCVICKMASAPLQAQTLYSIPSGVETRWASPENPRGEKGAGGWNEKRRAFTQFYGSEDLDASLLIMPLVFFMAPNDPRMLNTISAILQILGRVVWSVTVSYTVIRRNP